MKIVTVLILW